MGAHQHQNTEQRSTVALLKHSFVFVNAPVNASEIDFQFSSWAGTVHLV